jgi:hypothetical protein
VELVESDFFERIAARADLYLLKWVLHDWDDAACIRILGNVAAANQGAACGDWGGPESQPGSPEVLHDRPPNA